jgi:predicted amidohydrolase YtcJ
MIALSLDDTMSEVALGVLADLAAASAAASAAARREMAEDEAAPRALVEAVARHGSARCQEHATYLGMALAHGGGHAGRELMRWMRRIGVVQALLEVSLLGSPLARSRATKILQWFKDDG